MKPAIVHSGKPFAIYAEFARKENIKMKNGLNRRVFNITESEHGHDIQLEKDGSITLLPGTYRITGFSIVTMQVTMDPVVATGSNYPGYCLLYEKQYESDNPLGNNMGIGSPGTALDGAPSLFDLFFTCTEPAHICVGHQSGEDLHDEVYLSVYEVDGIPSEYHVFARIAITKL